MMSGLRKLRGVLGTAVTWGASWFGVGAVGWALGLFPEGLAFAIPTAGVLATVGAIAGAAFATALTLIEDRKTLGDLTIPRISGWGAVGGILIGIPMAIGMTPIGVVAMCSFLATLGAGSAAGSLALARLAENAGSIEAGDSDLLQLDAPSESS